MQKDILRLGQASHAQCGSVQGEKEMGIPLKLLHVSPTDAQQQHIITYMYLHSNQKVPSRKNPRNYEIETSHLYLEPFQMNGGLLRF